MQTNDSSNLFKTDAQLEKEDGRALKLERTKALGDPIKVTSRPLAMEVRGDECWTAESGFSLRRMNLKTGKTLQLYKGHTGPVTCLAFWDVPATKETPARHLMFSGSWDKSIRLWDTETATLVSSTTTHTDFLKTILVLPHLPHPLLVTGSSDKAIHIFSLTSALTSPEALPLLKTLKTHTRPVTKLVSALQTERGEVRFYSGDSLGRIVVWEVKEVDDQVVVKEVERLVEHKTVVTDLWVDEEGIWSSSADTSAHFHSLTSPTSPPTPSALPNPLTTYATPAIHALLPLPHLTPPLLLTGSSDEHIRIWDLSQGESSARMIREVEGHCAEVMGLRRWVREEEGKKEEWVVSSGLDGTIRRWRLADLLIPPPELEKKAEESEEGGLLDGGMTEEEARELAELMSDED
ncbi:WD40-repeat-containing domain protein [Mrakia frigida]|uniref:WD40-repeat-containing domain protein n=1 Tax=Mrakia frigida TaxID=29902 RepID=UPI003FCC0B66